MTIPLYILQKTITASSYLLSIPGPQKSLIYSIHLLWKVNQEVQDTTKNSTSFVAYIAGWLANKAIGNGLVGNIMEKAAVLILIARRVQDCMHRFFRIYRSFQDCKCVLQGKTFQVNYHTGLQSSKILAFLDPSIRMWISIQRQLLMIRISSLVKNFCFFWYEVFNFSNELILLSEAMKLDPTQKDEAKNKMLLNTWNIISDIARNKDNLNDELKENQELIRKILLVFGTDLNFDLVLKSVNSVGKISRIVTDKTNTTVKTAAVTAGSAIVTFVNNSITFAKFVFTGNVSKEVAKEQPSEFNRPPLKLYLSPIFKISLPVTPLPISPKLDLITIESIARKRLTNSHCRCASALQRDITLKQVRVVS